MFHEKIRQIFALLGVTLTEFARAAGCDKSNISRIASGARVPKNGGAGARRLVDAIYLCSDEKDGLDALCTLISCEDRTSAHRIRERIMAWLYDGEETAVRRPERTEEKNGKVPYRAFGERLDALMKLTGLSNIRLGRSLNTDPSYISRFRSGLRSPRANPKVMSDLCSLLLSRALEQGKGEALGKLIGMPEEALSDREAAWEWLYRWLFSAESGDGTPLVERLVDRIGSFSADIKKPPLSFEEAADIGLLRETTTAYCGVEGLRRAVIRFLGNIVERGEKELFLYSDQNMEWMVSDPEFRAKWVTLMILCVTGGTRITVVHNINRDLSEMEEAIESWLPLYPSGMIRAFWCRTSGGDRFSTTMFLCPGYACITGCNIGGAEAEKGLYRFDTDPALLGAHEAFYGELLNRSGELAGVHGSENIGRLGEEDITSLSVITNTLSLATMPETVILSALERAGADEAEKARVIDLKEKRLSVLESKAKKGFLHEFVPTPGDEELFEGRVPMDIPGFSLAYTPSEYAEHIRGILAISERCAGYRFCALPEEAFEDIRLLISDRAVAVERLRAPYVTILLEQPDLCRAFTAYAERIREKYKQDRLTTKAMLERYL